MGPAQGHDGLQIDALRKIRNRSRASLMGCSSGLCYSCTIEVETVQLLPIQLEPPTALIAAQTGDHCFITATSSCVSLFDWAAFPCRCRLYLLSGGESACIDCLNQSHSSCTYHARVRRNGVGCTVDHLLGPYRRRCCVRTGESSKQVGRQLRCVPSWNA